MKSFMKVLAMTLVLSLLFSALSFSANNGVPVPPGGVRISPVLEVNPANPNEVILHVYYEQGNDPGLTVDAIFFELQFNDAILTPVDAELGAGWANGLAAFMNVQQATVASVGAGGRPSDVMWTNWLTSSANVIAGLKMSIVFDYGSPVTDLNALLDEFTITPVAGSIAFVDLYPADFTVARTVARFPELPPEAFVLTFVDYITERDNLPDLITQGVLIEGNADENDYQPDYVYLVVTFTAPFDEDAPLQFPPQRIVYPRQIPITGAHVESTINLGLAPPPGWVIQSAWLIDVPDFDPTAQSIFARYPAPSN